MSWGPEDWDIWRGQPAVAEPGIGETTHALRQVLERIPDRGSKTIADLGSNLGARLPLTAVEFGRVFAVDDVAAGLDATRDLRPFPSRVHVAVALDSLRLRSARQLDLVLEQIHQSLVEGGMLLATFPAPPRRLRPYRLDLDGTEESWSGALHEVELQYRLRRCGFRGLRIRRIKTGIDDPDTLLCMAVRRANN